MPKSVRTARPANALIASLPPADRAQITAACDTSELELGAKVCRPGDTLRHVYFPNSGFISLITPAGAAESLEVGMVGDEGMFGITLLLDVKSSPLLGLVQGGGSALRMSAARFAQAVNDSAAFRRTLNRYLFVLTSQLAQTAACSRFHLLDARMARWLLMSQDRAHSDTFHLTHEFLAYMLGVRRAGVTEAAGRLQEAQLIHYVRGVLTVRDRKGLEAVSCLCYRTMDATYHEHLGKRRRPVTHTVGRKVFAK